MNIWQVSWYTPLLVEANKFWFYSICASISRNIYSLYRGRPTVTETQPLPDSARAKSQGESSAVSNLATVVPFLRRTIVNACDLALPASFVGWVILDDLHIGIAMTASTVLVWHDVWMSTQIEHS